MTRPKSAAHSWTRLTRAGAGLLPAIPVVFKSGVRPLAQKMAGSHQVAKLNLFLSASALGIPRQEIPRLARRVLFYRLLNDLDFDFLRWTPFAGRGIERLHELLAEGRGALVASQHFGAYRRFYHELLRRGFEVSLVVDSRVSGDLASATAGHLRRQGLEESVIDRRLSRFEVIDAEEQGSVRRILRALDANRAVLFYLDGNTGTEAPGEPEDAKSTGRSHEILRGFGHELRVRLGMAEIAHRRGLPILPVFCRWQSDLRPYFEFLPPIPHDASLPSQEAAQRSMQIFFDLFSARMREAPDQFEHLIYLHRWLVPAAPMERSAIEAARVLVERRLSAGRGVRWARERAGLFELGRQRFLVQAQTGRLLSARGAVETVARTLQDAASSSLPLARLSTSTKIEPDTLVDVLATLHACDILDWSEDESVRQPALALSSD